MNTISNIDELDKNVNKSENYLLNSPNKECYGSQFFLLLVSHSKTMLNFILKWIITDFFTHCGKDLWNKIICASTLKDYKKTLKTSTFAINCALFQRKLKYTGWSSQV